MKTITTGEKVIISKKRRLSPSRPFLMSFIRFAPGMDRCKTNQEVSHTLVEEVLQQPDAIMNLMDIKSFDDYTFTHNINVATISLMIGQALGLQKADLEDLGTGGMLHDVGKLKIPLSILNKDGNSPTRNLPKCVRTRTTAMKFWRNRRVSAKEREWSRCSTTKSFRVGAIRASSRAPNFSFARICAVADVYDALTTDRPYRIAMTSMRR